jgi:dihydroneopterin aldolase
MPIGDRVEVRGLRFDAVHGVLAHERLGPQPFEVDLDLYLDTAPAVSSDDIGDSADYAAAADAAAAVMAGPAHNLVESLAGAIADAVLADPRVEAVTVAVRKLAPPVPHVVASAGVRLHRRRQAGPAGEAP